MATYNGHKNWNYWNVSLWIGNDEGLYNMARDYVRHCKTRDIAAREFVRAINECGFTKTPDGARYTVSAVREAMIGL